MTPGKTDDPVVCMLSLPLPLLVELLFSSEAGTGGCGRGDVGFLPDGVGLGGWLGGGTRSGH